MIRKGVPAAETLRDRATVPERLQSWSFRFLFSVTEDDRVWRKRAQRLRRRGGFNRWLSLAKETRRLRRQSHSWWSDCFRLECYSLPR
nr:hypothetical protein CFP56_21644 [Quercus suber]